MSWIVVQTKPNQEILAQVNLQRQGYKVYCPMMKKRVAHARKIKKVLRPLFPGYLFLKLDRDSSWRPILSTIGVCTPVQFGDVPAHLDEGIINSLKEREIDGCFPQDLQETLYEENTQVRIIGGPFHDFIARVLDCNAKDRLVLLFNFMNRTIRLNTVRDNVLVVTS